MMGMLRLPLGLFVLGYQSLFLALSQVWANKMRSMLTMVGIIIGVSSVTAVIAALTGLKTNVLSEFESFGTNKIYIVPDRPDTGPMRNAPRARIWFQPPVFDGLESHCPSIRNFTRVTSMGGEASYGERRIDDLSISGIEPAWHSIENRPIALGRPFTMMDNTLARPVCLINSKLRDKLGMPTDCIGKQILMGQKGFLRRYLIVGVVEDKSESSGFRDGISGAELMVPFNTAWVQGQSLPFQPFVMAIAAAKSPEVSDEARAELEFFMRKKRKIPPGDPPTFRIEAIDQFVKQFNEVAAAITLVATGIVGISLLVGGVGIMNIMLVSVSERTREIGLRKAVGARPAAILLQFLVEAVMLCFIGGAMGLLFGALITKGLASIPNAKLEQAYIPVWAVIMSFSFAATVGLIFGMFPAIKAARLDPIDALRHE